MALTTDRDLRKASPIFSGCLAYFPDALAAVAALSKAGNDFHNPGQPLHWDRSKSSDHADCVARHLIDHGTYDTDGQRHSTKVAWRALALLQVEIEREQALSQLTAEAQAMGLYEPPCHPMASEALRDEFERNDQSTGL